MNEHKPSVFLSYSSRDQELVDDLRRSLADAGFMVVRPQELPSGSEFERAIREMMRQSDAFVLVASDDALGSPWTAFELGAAMAWEKPIFVVSADDGDRLPAYLTGHQIVKKSDVARLVGFLKREAAPLTAEERGVLLSAYVELGVPSDELAVDPGAASKLVEEFNQRSRNSSRPDRLLRELLRLRKSGGLPKLRRSAARTVREKRSA